MSIKTRRILFYSFVILFLIIGTLVVLFSRGLRFDFKDLNFVETGGAYISSTPIDTQISFDDKVVKNKSGVFQRGTLISGITPGEHSLKIESLGYSTWQKNFDVEPAGVSVFDSIVIVPNQEPELLQNVQASKLSSRNSYFVFESKGGVILDEEVVFGHEIIDFTKDNKLLTRSNQTGNYYLTDASSPESSLNISLVFNNLKSKQLGLPGLAQIKDIKPYPNNGNRFVISTEAAIYTLDTQRSSIEQIVLGVNNFTIQGNDRLVWTDEGKIETFSLSFRNKSTAFEHNSIEANGRGVYLIDGTWIVWTLNNELIITGKENKQIASGVKEVLSSPDGKKIVFVKESNLVLYSISEDRTINLININSGLEQVAWFGGGSYLFVLSGRQLNFVEVDNRTPINVVNLNNDTISFSYEDGENFVLFLDQTGVWQKSIKL